MSIFKSSNDIGLFDMAVFLNDSLGQSYNASKIEADHIFASAGALGVDLPNGDSTKPHKFSEFYGAKAGNPYWDNGTMSNFAKIGWTRNRPENRFEFEKNGSYWGIINTTGWIATYINSEMRQKLQGKSKWVTYTVTSYYNNTSYEMPFYPEIDDVQIPVSAYLLNSLWDCRAVTKTYPTYHGPLRFWNHHGYGYQMSTNFLNDFDLSADSVMAWLWIINAGDPKMYGSIQELGLYHPIEKLSFRDAWTRIYRRSPNREYPGGGVKFPDDFFGRNNLNDNSISINLDTLAIKLTDPGSAVTDNNERILLYNKHTPFNGVKTVDNWDGMYQQVYMMKINEPLPGREDGLTVTETIWFQDNNPHQQGYVELKANNVLKYHIEREVISGVITYRVKNESNQILFSEGSTSSSGVATAKSNAIAFWENLHFREQDYYQNSASLYPNGRGIFNPKDRRSYMSDWNFIAGIRWHDDGITYSGDPYDTFYTPESLSFLSKYREELLNGALDQQGYHLSFYQNKTYNPGEYVWHYPRVYKSSQAVPVDEPPRDAEGNTNTDYWDDTGDKTISHKYMPRLNKSGLKLHLFFEIDLPPEDKLQALRAARLWEQIIQDDMEIEVLIFPTQRARAVGGTLASAKPFSSSLGNYITNPLYPKAKVDQILIFIDVEDLYHPYSTGRNVVSNPIIPGATQFFYIMFHEIAHGLGLGTLWNRSTWSEDEGNHDYGNQYNFLHTNGFGAQYGGAAVGYRGSNCLREYELAVQNAQYIKVYSPSAQDIINISMSSVGALYTDSVPIQDAGQEATLLSVDYGGHFAEFAKIQGQSDTQSEATSGLNSIQPSFGDEIMSPMYNNPRAPISRITLGAIEDLGYTVDYSFGQVNETPVGYTGTAYLYYRWYQELTNAQKASYNNDLSNYLDSNESSMAGQLNQGRRVRMCGCKAMGHH